MRIGLPVAALAAVFTYGCVAPRERAPEPEPQRPVAAPRPAPVPAPPPAPASAPPVGWDDLPDTSGAWRYSGASGVHREAAFLAGAGGTGEVLFSILCEPERRRVILFRPGAVATAQARLLNLRTTSVARALPVSALDADADGPEGARAELSATDPLLDAMAYSRGHFTVEAAGTPRLVLPAHPEVARVVEDCRS